MRIGLLRNVAIGASVRSSRRCIRSPARLAPPSARFVLAAVVTLIGLALAWPAARVLAHERFRGLLDPATAGLALLLTLPALVLVLVLEAALGRRTPLAG